MNEEILKRIDVLAAKLNTTGEHLWRVLVAQQKVEAIMGLLLFLLGVCIIVSVIWYVHKLWKSDYNPGDVDVMMTFVVVVIGIVVCGVNFDWWGRLINPEYYALKEILEVLK
jgi:Mn2+/Fe2+ NRAMP family transporter